MRRKFTITFKEESGNEVTKVFGAKKKAKEYCQYIGQLYKHSSLIVTLIVQCGDSMQTETFIKSAR